MGSFRIPHAVISKILPADTQVAASDWENLIRRADDMEMERRSQYEQWTRGNGLADEYEGTWLDQWVKNGYAQRMFPQEAALVPLFHATTRKPDQIDEASSSNTFTPVAYTAMDGEANGVSLRELGRRIASTNLERRDGDPTHVEFEAISDANQALTGDEQKALRAMLERYFQRDTSIEAFKDPTSGVRVTFGAHEIPHDFKVESPTKASYSMTRTFQELVIDAPQGSRVSFVPMTGDDKWLSRETASADVGANGQARFPLGHLSNEVDRIAVYVVRDPDGAGGPEVPQLAKRLQIKLPLRRFNKTIDKTERLARLVAGRP